MVRSPKPPSQTWRTFLNNHISQLASVDFFTVHTVWFEVLFVLLSSHTIDDASCTSTSPLIQRLNGRRSKCSKPFRLIPRLDICCEIEIESMGRSSATESHY